MNSVIEQFYVSASMVYKLWYGSTSSCFLYARCKEWNDTIIKMFCSICPGIDLHCRQEESVKRHRGGPRYIIEDYTDIRKFIN
jgi:hypothetical protein